MLNRKTQNFFLGGLLTKNFFERKRTKWRPGKKFFEHSLEKGGFTNVLTKCSTNLLYI